MSEHIGFQVLESSSNPDHGLCPLYQHVLRVVAYHVLALDYSYDRNLNVVLVYYLSYDAVNLIVLGWLVFQEVLHFLFLFNYNYFNWLALYLLLRLSSFRFVLDFDFGRGV